MGTVVLSALRIADAGELAGRASDALHRLLESKGEVVQVLDLEEADVSPCLGCGRCSEAGECVLRDDMSRMIRLIASCDRLVLAGPILFGTHHPTLKRAVDRLLPLAGELFTIRRGEMHHRPRHPGRLCLLGVGKLREGAPQAEAESFERLIGRHALNIAARGHAAVVISEAGDVDEAIRAGLERTERDR